MMRKDKRMAPADYYFIVNPAAKSGRGIRIWEQARELLAEAGASYRFYMTRTDRNATAIAGCLLRSVPGELRLILLGGDGTVNEALQGIAAYGAFERVRLAYVPAGSSNDLARALGYPEDPLEVLRAVLFYDGYGEAGGSAGAAQRDAGGSTGAVSGSAGTVQLGEKRIDLGELTYHDATDAALIGTKRLFVVSCGIGFDASVCAEALKSGIKDGLNRLGLGALAYGSICVKQLLTSPLANCYVFTDGRKIRYAQRSLFVAVMNHRYQGGGVMFTPDAVDDDGLLDLCYTDRMSRLSVLKTLPKAYKGQHTRTPGIRIDRSSRVRVSYDTPLYVHTDGEVATRARDISVRCLPGCLRLLSP